MHIGKSLCLGPVLGTGQIVWFGCRTKPRCAADAHTAKTATASTAVRKLATLPIAANDLGIFLWACCGPVKVATGAYTCTGQNLQGKHPYVYLQCFSVSTATCVESSVQVC